MSAEQYPHLSESIVRNLREKVRDFLLKTPKSKDATLRVVVYGDKEDITYRMWNSIFHEDVNFIYKKIPELTPTPPGYSREMYDDYETEMRQVVADYVRDQKLDIVWDIYDVSTLQMYPRMHLLLANRRIQKTEFGPWAGVDERGNWLPLPVDRPSSQISQAVGAGEGSASAIPLRRSSRISRKYGQAHSSSAGGTSSSAGLSSGVHNDRRFIAVETLRCLVASVMKIKLPSVRQGLSSSSLVSTAGTRSSSRSRQPSRGLQRSAACAPSSSMSFDSDDAPSTQSSAQPATESSSEDDEQ